jgi:hypothetical protein
LKRYLIWIQTLVSNSKLLKRNCKRISIFLLGTLCFRPKPPIGPILFLFLSRPTQAPGPLSLCSPCSPFSSSSTTFHSRAPLLNLADQPPSQHRRLASLPPFGGEQPTGFALSSPFHHFPLLFPFDFK